MYGWLIDRLVRRTYRDLTEGNVSRPLALFADDACFEFPGQNRWAGQHRGKPAIEAWLRRLVEDFHPRFEVHDVAVRGWPWDVRVCTRFTDYFDFADGKCFINHGMQYLRITWGKVRLDRIYPDTEVVAAVDKHARSLEH